jgi:hypothetical protein
MERDSLICLSYSYTSLKKYQLKTHAQNVRTASYDGAETTTAKRTAITDFTVHARLYKLGEEKRLVRTHYYLRPFMVYCGNGNW